MKSIFFDWTVVVWSLTDCDFFLVTVEVDICFFFVWNSTCQDGNSTKGVGSDYKRDTKSVHCVYSQANKRRTSWFSSQRMLHEFDGLSRRKKCKNSNQWTTLSNHILCQWRSVRHWGTLSSRFSSFISHSKMWTFCSSFIPHPLVFISWIDVTLLWLFLVVFAD